MLPEQIRTRCGAVRLGKKELAGLAGLSQKSAGMILRGQSMPRLNNLQSLERAVLAEEIRLRDYLNGLHPVDQRETSEAAE